MKGLIDGKVEVGEKDGKHAGLLDGAHVRNTVGLAEVELDGLTVGNTVGLTVGVIEGLLEDAAVGTFDGLVDGTMDGSREGGVVA